MKLTSLLCATIASAALVSGGCGSGSSGTASNTSAPAASGGQPAAKHLKLAFVTNNESDYWTIVRKGVEKAEKELPNVEVDFRMPPAQTAGAQRQIVDDLLAKGVDGIAISPADAKDQTDMINKWAGQTLVITSDSDAPQTDRACYIGTDNVAAGRKAADEIKKSLPQGGKIVLFVGTTDAQNAQDRINGIKDGLKGSNVQVLDIRQDNADHTKAVSNVSDVLVKTPDIAGLVGIYSYNGPGIYKAVQDAGKIGKVKIVCFDEEDKTLEGVKNGAIDATIVQQPFNFGYLAVVDMNKYLNGDKSVFPANKLNIVDTHVLHKDDVDSFKANLDKLRGRS